MTAMTHDGLVETRQYNVLSQLTRITVAGQMDVEYRYSATQNNGQITQMKNWISGEEVNYTYDALGRLSVASTTGPEWGLSFGYDGFGNKVLQTVTKGSGPSMSVAVDGNNRVVGHTYDAAGFTTAVSGTFTSLTWDGAGRLLSAAVSGGGTDSYQYDPSNARVWRNNRFFLRGVGGEVLAVYDFNPVTKTFAFVRRYAWFAGKMVGKKEDRLGTVLQQADQSGSRFYPYGEEWPATTQDDTKFATYWRDGSTNLDYAMNRYYQSTLGRFLSPDPFRGSASKARSGSWNRYAYVEGDPANANDPSGLCRVIGTHFICDVVETDVEIKPTIGWTGNDLPDLSDRDVGPGMGWARPRLDPAQMAQGLIGAVAAGVFTECTALAQFADIMAEDTRQNTGHPALWASEFVSQFRVFIRSGDPNVNRANTLAGIPIEDSGSRTPPQLGNGRLPAFPGANGLSSGYREEYIDQLELDSLNSGHPQRHDQSHHFGAFFQFGYHSQAMYGGSGFAIANGMAAAIDLTNPGDRNLSYAALGMGRGLALGSSTPADVGTAIRRTLCH